MASLTIRKLDDAIKTYLRLRSAKNGRSVEEEVRVILGNLIEGVPVDTLLPGPGAAAIPAPQPRAADNTGNARVTLIIGGGIAAYKSLDLIRRLKERRIRVRCVLTKAALHFVTALSASALSGERAFTDLFDPESEFDAGHIRLARDRRPDGQDRQWPCRRSCQRDPARGEPPDPAGSGDESVDVE